VTRKKGAFKVSIKEAVNKRLAGSRLATRGADQIIKGDEVAVTWPIPKNLSGRSNTFATFAPGLANTLDGIVHSAAVNIEPGAGCALRVDLLRLQAGQRALRRPG
jgi:hypothetical protein